MKTALILFAHGSRDPSWAAPFHAIKAKIAAAKPDLRVELAYLELMEPALRDAMNDIASDGHRHIAIAPLFMAQGAHVKRDLSLALQELRKQHSNLDIEVLPAVGEIDAILAAISESVLQSLARDTPR